MVEMSHQEVPEWVTAYIGLGSNIGDRAGYLARAIHMLQEHSGIRLEACSAIYETAPVGFTDQPSFLNQVIRIATLLTPKSLLEWMLATEQQLGRERHIRWGPRTIDLDLLLYGDLVMETGDLTIPHPRMMERAFVLVPLQEVYQGNRLLPKESLSRLVEKLDGKEGVKLWTN